MKRKHNFVVTLNVDVQQYSYRGRIEASKTETIAAERAVNDDQQGPPTTYKFIKTMGVFIMRLQCKITFEKLDKVINGTFTVSLKSGLYFDRGRV